MACTDLEIHERHHFCSKCTCCNPYESRNVCILTLKNEDLVYSIQIPICIYLQTNFNYLSFQLSPSALAVQKHTDGPVAMQIDHTLNMSIAPCVDDKMAGIDDSHLRVI